MNELKRELSKVTGIDFFNPKFREIFKKHFPNDKDAEEEIYSAGIYVKRFLFYKNGGNIAQYNFLPDLEYVIKAKLN